LFAIGRGRRGEAFDKVPMPDSAKMPWTELVTLLSGIITVSGFYIIDIYNTFFS
jgi:hypothetical protein